MDEGRREGRRKGEWKDERRKGREERKTEGRERGGREGGREEVRKLVCRKGACESHLSGLVDFSLFWSVGNWDQQYSEMYFGFLKRGENFQSKLSQDHLRRRHLCSGNDQVTQVGEWACLQKLSWFHLNLIFTQVSLSEECFLSSRVEPWPLWLGWLEYHPVTGRLQVRLPVRAHT